MVIWQWENTWHPHHSFMVTLASIRGLSLPAVRAPPSCWRGEIVSGRDASRFTSGSLLILTPFSWPRDHGRPLEPCSCLKSKCSFRLVVVYIPFLLIPESCPQISSTVHAFIAKIGTSTRNLPIWNERIEEKIYIRCEFVNGHILHGFYFVLKLFLNYF